MIHVVAYVEQSDSKERRKLNLCKAKCEDIEILFNFRQYFNIWRLLLHLGVWALIHWTSVADSSTAGYLSFACCYIKSFSQLPAHCPCALLSCVISSDFCSLAGLGWLGRPGVAILCCDTAVGLAGLGWPRIRVGFVYTRHGAWTGTGSFLLNWGECWGKVSDWNTWEMGEISTSRHTHCTKIKCWIDPCLDDLYSCSWSKPAPLLLLSVWKMGLLCLNENSKAKGVFSVWCLFLVCVSRSLT